MFRTYVGQSSAEEAARRALEWCGSISGVPCLVVAIDDTFVVPIPSTMKVVGFFNPSNAPIAPALRGDVAQRLAGAGRGWNALATGVGGHPGLGLKGTTESDAIGTALAECAKQDRNCRVVAIGPFSVEPK
jgi:adenylate cyclase